MKSWGEREWRSLFSRAARLLKALAAGALLLMAAAHWQVYRASSPQVHERTSALPRRTVAIVPGALVYSDGQLSPTVADRVACGAELYHKGKVQRVLVSGDHGRAHYDEVNAMADALVARGVRPEHVFLDHAGFRTLDTMHRARDVFGVRDAIVCTQRFHLPRALYLAHAFGIAAEGKVADKRTYVHARFDWARERLAVTKAFLDVLLGRRARLLGPREDIRGDGRKTRDSVSQK